MRGARECARAASARNRAYTLPLRCEVALGRSAIRVRCAQGGLSRHRLAPARTALRAAITMPRCGPRRDLHWLMSAENANVSTSSVSAMMVAGGYHLLRLVGSEGAQQGKGGRCRPLAPTCSRSLRARRQGKAATNAWQGRTFACKATHGVSFMHSRPDGGMERGFKTGVKPPEHAEAGDNSPRFAETRGTQRRHAAMSPAAGSACPCRGAHGARVPRHYAYTCARGVARPKCARGARPAWHARRRTPRCSRYAALAAGPTPRRMGPPPHSTATHTAHNGSTTQ